MQFSARVLSLYRYFLYMCPPFNRFFVLFLFVPHPILIVSLIMMIGVVDQEYKFTETYGDTIGILPSDFLTLSLPLFEGIVLLVLELHFVLSFWKSDNLQINSLGSSSFFAIAQLVLPVILLLLSLNCEYDCYTLCCCARLVLFVCDAVLPILRNSNMEDEAMHSLSAHPPITTQAPIFSSLHIL